LVGSVFNINIDGYLGVGMCLYIILSGISIIKDTINKLIGGTPDKDLIKKVLYELNKDDDIIGVHDVLYHCYGLGEVYMTVHAEMDSAFSLLLAHDIVDKLEKKIQKMYNVELVVHVDPVLLNDELLSSVGYKLKKIIDSISPELKYHELKIVNKKRNVNICFDLQVPYKFHLGNKEIYDLINKELRMIDDNYRASITFER
jgi:divalent metal cation (Fe/Co/Zn/Cd) transporter